MSSFPFEAFLFMDLHAQRQMPEREHMEVFFYEVDSAN
jgi:hypothetical protein